MSPNKRQQQEEFANQMLAIGEGCDILNSFGNPTAQENTLCGLSAIALTSPTG